MNIHATNEYQYDLAQHTRIYNSLKYNFIFLPLMNGYKYGLT